LISCSKKEDEKDCPKRTLTYIIHYPNESKTFRFTDYICDYIVTSHRGSNELKVRTYDPEDQSWFGANPSWGWLEQSSAPIEVISLK
jgi:hypothetical protein